MNALPQWLTPAPHLSANSNAPAPEDEQDLDPENPDAAWRKALILRHENNIMRRRFEEQTFAAVFDDILEHVESGQPLKSFAEMRPLEFNYRRCISWIMRDETRKNRYHDAQAVAAEVLNEETPEIADASDSLEDVARSTLRINDRKRRMAVYNRKRFGDIKQVDQNITIDLSAAMQEAQDRLDRSRVIDVQARVVDNG